eukprot:9190543-Lingulodinium_polyedra.AAC.1
MGLARREGNLRLLEVKDDALLDAPVLFLDDQPERRQLRLGPNVGLALLEGAELLQPPAFPVGDHLVHRVVVCIEVRVAVNQGLIIEEVQGVQDVCLLVRSGEDPIALRQLLDTRGRANAEPLHHVPARIRRAHGPGPEEVPADRGGAMLRPHGLDGLGAEKPRENLPEVPDPRI